MANKVARIHGETVELIEQRVTIYSRGEMFGNIIRTECRYWHVRRGPYAQYSAAHHVAFVPKGAQKIRAYADTSSEPTTLVLEGWGHPKGADLFGETRTDSKTGLQVRESRYMSCDPRWRSDFDAMIAEHIEKTGAKILYDARGTSPYDKI